jgi:hypothetical protein
MRGGRCGACCPSSAGKQMEDGGFPCASHGSTQAWVGVMVTLLSHRHTRRCRTSLWLRTQLHPASFPPLAPWTDGRPLLAVRTLLLRNGIGQRGLQCNGICAYKMGASGSDSIAGACTSRPGTKARRAYCVCPMHRSWTPVPSMSHREPVEHPGPSVSATGPGPYCTQSVVRPCPRVLRERWLLTGPWLCGPNQHHRVAHSIPHSTGAGAAVHVVDVPA